MLKFKEYGLNQLCDWFSIKSYPELDKDLTPARKNWHPSRSSDARKRKSQAKQHFEFAYKNTLTIY
jgi:hypothetical protein